MRLLCVVPARLGSSRLPEKPLRLLAGEPLIRVVTRRVLALDLGAHIVIAADDARILEAVAELGVDGVLTDPAHRSGTERVAEVVRRPPYRDVDVVLNVQGDEPGITREAALGAVARVAAGDAVGTAAHALADGELWHPHRVKVRVDPRGRALEFFRTPTAPACAHRAATLRHVGIYAYAPAALARWVALTPVAEEFDEGLEQLRPLRHGMAIGVAPLADAVPPGIDTEEDLRLVEATL